MKNPFNAYDSLHDKFEDYGTKSENSLTASEKIAAVALIVLGSLGLIASYL